MKNSTNAARINATVKFCFSTPNRVTNCSTPLNAKGVISIAAATEINSLDFRKSKNLPTFSWGALRLTKNL
jgi:hypothetical protein